LGLSSAPLLIPAILGGRDFGGSGSYAREQERERARAVMNRGKVEAGESRMPRGERDAQETGVESAYAGGGDDAADPHGLDWFLPNRIWAISLRLDSREDSVPWWRNRFSLLPSLSSLIHLPQTTINTPLGLHLHNFFGFRWTTSN
jgi:hypothetical protein